MKYFEFYDHCQFTLYATGNSNWDLYLMQYGGGKPLLASIAKPGTGAADSQFGGLDYLEKLERRGVNHGYTRVA